MKKYYFLFILTVLVTLSSCLKERPSLDPKESNNVIEIYEPIPVPTASPATAVYPLYSSSFDISPSAPFELKVSYSGADVAPEDIQVTLALDQAALTAYNAEQGSNFTFAPASIFTVDNWNVTIPKGKRVATKIVTFRPDQFNPALSYGFPVKIVTASKGVISSNYGTVIYSFSAKNKYDGVYSSKFKHNGWIAYGIYDGSTAVTYGEMALVTTGATTNSRMNVGRGDFLQAGISVDGSGNLGATAFGAVTPLFTFDASTNKLLSYTNTTADDGRGRKLRLDPAVTDSRYDPSAKKIYAAYIMSQNGRPDLVYRDTLTFLRSR